MPVPKPIGLRSPHGSVRLRRGTRGFLEHTKGCIDIQVRLRPSIALKTTRWSVNVRNAGARGITMAFLGELWFLPGSPFSLPAYWAVVHARVRVKLRRCVPLLSTLLLWIRLGLPRRHAAPLSLPILLRPGSGLVRGAAAIARAADAARANPADSASLFPPRAVVEIDKAMRAADTLCRHGRALLLGAMCNDPRTAEKVVLPRLLRNRLFSNALLRFFAARMRAKYPIRVSRDQVREALLGMRRLRASGGGMYICAERFTYADICMAASMYFAVCRAPGSPSDVVYGDKDLREEFNDLVEWRRAVFDEHYPGSELDAYRFAPPLYKNA
jgi:glutathione S-transferase